MKSFSAGTVVCLLWLSLPALPVSAQQRLYSYQCDSGRSFQVEYSPDLARLNTGSGRPIPLAQVETASGTRYSNGQVTLYTKGNTAFVEEGNQRTYSNCVEASQAREQAGTTVYTVTYQCQGDRAFSARYSNQEAKLLLDNRSLTLPQVESGSGARYSNGETTLYIKGNSAFIEENGTETYENCLAQTSSTTEQPDSDRSTEQPIRGMW